MNIQIDLKWTDIEYIAIELEELHPEMDILAMRFTDLWKMIQDISAFNDDPNKSNEKILEAIQMAWLEERNDA